MLALHRATSSTNFIMQRAWRGGKTPRPDGQFLRGARIALLPRQHLKMALFVHFLHSAGLPGSSTYPPACHHHCTRTQGQLHNGKGEPRAASGPDRCKLNAANSRTIPPTVRYFTFDRPTSSSTAPTAPPRGRSGSSASKHQAAGSHSLNDCRQSSKQWCSSMV